MEEGVLEYYLIGHVLPGYSNLDMVLLVHHLTGKSFKNGNLNYIKVINVVTVTWYMDGTVNADSLSWFDFLHPKLRRTNALHGLWIETPDPVTGVSN